jgi:hypothetical protein
METKILAALERFRNGDDDTALAGLLDLPDEIVPAMVEIFRGESDPDLRAFLVRVAWERHEEFSVNFILEALNDRDEEVWQVALDGTVALASPEILDVLKSLRLQERADAAMTKRFQMCVDEAILYVEGLVRGGQHPHLSPLPSRERK